MKEVLNRLVVPGIFRVFMSSATPTVPSFRDEGVPSDSGTGQTYPQTGPPPSSFKCFAALVHLTPGRAPPSIDQKGKDPSEREEDSEEKRIEKKKGVKKKRRGGIYFNHLGNYYTFICFQAESDVF